MELRDLIADCQASADDTSNVFCEAAIRALQNAKPHQKPMILIDLSKHIGCHPGELTFLTDTTDGDDDLILPEYRETLLAAE